MKRVCELRATERVDYFRWQELTKAVTGKWPE